MSNNHLKIIFSLSVVIIFVGIFLFFVWSGALQEKDEKPNVPRSGNVERWASNVADSEPKLLDTECLTCDFEVFIKPFEKIIPILPPEILPQQKEESEEIPTLAESEVGIPIPKGVGTKQITLSLTADEFHFLYPDIFINSLIEAQNLFIKEYYPNYAPLAKIETDAHVRFVEEKIVDALFASKMITKEQANIYINTIRITLPELQLEKLQDQKLSSLNGPVPIGGLFLVGLIGKLRSLLISQAQAACGACFYLPECFQVGAPNPAVGYTVWKPFCYCTGCFHGQGCLDFCTGQSAIWDPMTGICGCG